MQFEVEVSTPATYLREHSTVSTEEDGSRGNPGRVDRATPPDGTSFLLSPKTYFSSSDRPTSRICAWLPESLVPSS